MAALTLRDVGKTFGTVDVLRGIDLDVADGEFAVFVGPSGCGKSTLLRMIAGLETIERGEIRIGEDCVNQVAAADRGIAMVFQSYALYPHMTVAENLGFALKMAGQKRPAIEAAVGRAAEILQIGDLLSRRPAELSGGQRQRVAIGRAIVRKPKVFLFDEPLSNLDAALRVQMRLELARLHADLGATMVYVTHDQVEAMTLGDRIAVFHRGRIEQVGAPLTLYESPRTQFVAGFLGSPRMNFLRGQAQTLGESVLFTVAGAGQVSVARPVGRMLTQGALTLGVRPEHLALVPAGQGLAARITVLEHLGDALIVHASLRGSGDTLAVRVDAHHPGLAIGHEVDLLPQGAHVHLFDERGEALPTD